VDNARDRSASPNLNHDADAATRRQIRQRAYLPAEKHFALFVEINRPGDAARSRAASFQHKPVCLDAHDDASDFPR
jgi:hypothetical protein